MCEHTDEYHYLPSVTVGGPPGDYLLNFPIPSSEYGEFCVISIANTGLGSGVVQVSGIDQPKMLDTSGNSTYSNTTFIRSQVFNVAAGTTIFPGQDSWERIARTNELTFIRIDSASSSVIFVTVKFRAKIVKRIPAPFTTVHPNEPQEAHIERERRIRRAVWGEEGEAIEYGQEPVEHERVRQSGRTGELINARGLSGPTRRG